MEEEAVPFVQGEITVYLDQETLPYIDKLDIGLFEAYGEEMLLVEENFI